MTSTPSQEAAADDLAAEREGLETTKKGAEATAAAAKQLLTDGGHAELLHTLMQMVHGLSTKLEEVMDEVLKAYEWLLQI